MGGARKGPLLLLPHITMTTQGILTSHSNLSCIITSNVTVLELQYHQLTFIEASEIPNVRTMVNETTDTAHVVEVFSAVGTMDGNSVQCAFETYEEGIILSNAITFHIAPAAGELMLRNISTLCHIALVLYPMRLLCHAFVTSTQWYM